MGIQEPFYEVYLSTGSRHYKHQLYYLVAHVPSCVQSYALGYLLVHHEALLDHC